MKSIFITGISGFIGRYILEQIDPGLYNNIYCLCRSGKLSIFNNKPSNKIRVIKGDLLNPESYSKYLAECDIVLHLAALTGKANPPDYFHMNAYGTKILVRECERLDVTNFLFVSTIAVTFPDISRYYYAQSKKAAEDIVKSSRLTFSIVRPTIVIGNGGAIWLNLSKLGKGNYPVIFGNGKTEIQPIYAPDLAKILVSMVRDDDFHNGIYDIGGPDVVSFEYFLNLIHQAYTGKWRHVIHFPLDILLKILGLLERYLYDFLPINSGQLSSFRFDSVAVPSYLLDQHLLKMVSVKDMIRLVVEKERQGIIDEVLKKECQVFCDYLINAKVSEYVILKYREAQMIRKRDFQEDISSFDRFLMRFSIKNCLFTKLADCYTRVFYRKSILQKKLVLLVSIIESVYPFNRYFDSVDYKNKMVVFSAIFIKFLSFLFHLIVSIPFLAPFQIALARGSKSNLSEQI